MRFKKTLLTIVGVAAFSISSVSTADRFNDQVKYSANTQSGQELSVRVAPIKSVETLRSFLVMTPNRLNPLSLLTPSSRETFLNSLTFNEKGLTGFNYLVLKEELTTHQIERVLSLFGSQRTTYLIKDKTATVTPMLVDVDDGTCDAADCMDGGSSGGGTGWNGGTGGLTLPGPTPIPSSDLLNMECIKRATCAPRVALVCKNSC